MQALFYMVYLVCFAGCSGEKLHVVASPYAVHKVNPSSNKGKRKVHLVKDEEKGGAVFELGDSYETKGLVDD